MPEDDEATADAAPIVPVRRGRYASVLDMVKDLSGPEYFNAVTEADPDGVLRLRGHPVVRFPLADASPPAAPTIAGELVAGLGHLAAALGGGR